MNTLYNEYLSAIRNKHDLILFNRRMDRLVNKLYDNIDEYIKKMNCLLPGTLCFLYDNNLCVYNTIYKIVSFITPHAFFKSNAFILNDNEIQMFLKDYLLTYEKLKKVYFTTNPEFVRNMQPINSYILNSKPEKENHIKETTNTNVEKGKNTADIQFLYDITNGDIKTLYEFGKIIAHIYLYDYRQNRPAVILADKSEHKILIEFFSRFTDSPLYISMDKLHLNSSLHTILNYNLRFYLSNKDALIICAENKIKGSESVRNKLYPLLTGKTVKIKHPNYECNLNIKNRLPIIFITDSHDQYMILKNSYRAMGVKLPYNNELKDNYDYDFNRLVKVLGYVGFQWIKNKRQEGEGPFKTTKNDILHMFAENLCIIGENEKCDKQKMYSAYSEYCTKRFGGEPLTSKEFSIRFAAYGDFGSVRVHQSKNKSPYYFTGVSLDEKKYAQFSESTVTKLHSTYEDFEKKFNECIQKELEKARAETEL